MSTNSIPDPGEIRFDSQLIRHLPAERHASTQSSASGSKGSLTLDRYECASYQHSATLHGTMLPDFLLAGYAALLSRLTHQEVVRIACGAHSPLITSFNFEGDCSFQDILNRFEDADPTRPIGAEPAEIGYQFLTGKQQPGALNGPLSKAQLLLTVREQKEGLRLELTSSDGMWAEETLQSWLTYLKSLLAAAAHDYATPIRRLPLLDERATMDFYATLNETASEYPSESCFPELFAVRAKETPDAVAIVDSSQRLTYRELDERSNKLAALLISVGAAPNRAVAVCIDRSAELPVALLAVLKSGSYYVPLDPQNPRQRLLTILEECQPVAVISNASVAESLATPGNPLPYPVFCVDRPLPELISLPQPVVKAKPGDLAYTIYTSGTTGKPKGVMITHRALVNLLFAMRHEPGLQSSDRMLGVAPISFDIATMDMFLPMLVGATLVVADRRTAGDPYQLSALIEEHDITVLQATPATWQLLITSGWNGKQGLRMISGGEALPRQLANELLHRGGELWNCYGPTETTIYSAVSRIYMEAGIVSVGPPIANTSFYVLDETGRPLPPGLTGELCIGGVGVSRGYVGLPALSAERFVDDRFSRTPGGKLFRTGDLVRIVNGGELEFFGRLDHQVKLRGYRIELGEIESALRSHASVANAVVVLRDDAQDDPHLVAYITCKDGRPSERVLREFLGRSLPEYMLPARIVTLDQLGLTSSGKIDRRALPALENAQQSPETRPAGLNVLPGNELESQLLNIFRDVLREDSIGVTDSFFDYGGYSLLTVRLFARIDRVLGLKLPITLLFDAPTVRSLAQIIEKGGSLPIVVPIRPAGRAAPIFAIHSYLIYDVLHDVVEDYRPIYGLRELPDSLRTQTGEERAATYAGEIRRVCPAGPVHLAGWCAASSITVEIARQLRASGRQVALVALFDAECPGYTAFGAGDFRFFCAKIFHSLGFHARRLRRLHGRERVTYIKNALQLKWDGWTEAFFTRHHSIAVRFQRWFGFLLPNSVFEPAYLATALLQNPSAQPYPGAVSLFRATDVPRVPDLNEDETLGWKDLALGGVDVVFVPGDHETMFQKPHVWKFGQKLRNAMQRSENEGRSGAVLPKRASA